MKRWIPWLLLLALLLTGCAGTEQSTPPNPDEAAGQSAPAEKVYTAAEAREALGAWLEQDCSFDMLFRCLSLPGQYGYEEKINQRCAADGSFSFYISARWWDKGTGVDAEDRAEYHYAWEDETYVCTMRHNDEPVERIPMTRLQQEDLDQSRRQMIGVDTLLPAWAEDFRQEPLENAPELLCFRYALPVERLLREEDMLSKELDIVLQLQKLDAYPEGLHVKVSLCAEKESLRPQSVYYDFSELTPYVFEDWEHLPDTAEDTARMEMRFTFDFDLAETVPLPDTLRETAETGAALPEPGVIEDGEYRQPFFGLAFPLEGWELRDREERFRRSPVLLLQPGGALAQAHALPGADDAPGRYRDADPAGAAAHHHQRRECFLHPGGVHGRRRRKSAPGLCEHRHNRLFRRALSDRTLRHGL